MSRNPGQGNFGPPDPKEFYAHLRPRKTRQYVPAYRADNGIVCAIGRITPSLEDAEEQAESLRSPNPSPPVFVAFRELPDWTSIEELHA